MRRLARRAGATAAAALVLAALATSGCGTAGHIVQVPVAALAGSGQRPALVQHRPSQAPMARLVALARARWALEQWGPVVHRLLRRVAADPALARALRSGDPVAIRAAVALRFRPVWYHWHVSRLRIVRGRHVLVDVGVPFVVAASRLPVPGGQGIHLEVSDQDVVGFVRFMHRNHGVDVVARGESAGHVRTSLPAALRVRLPDHGTVTIAGRRYQVGSLVRRALGGERVRVWILARR